MRAFQLEENPGFSEQGAAHHAADLFHAVECPALKERREHRDFEHDPGPVKTSAEAAD